MRARREGRRHEGEEAGGVARDARMALAVPKQLDGRARGRPSGDHALAGRLDPNDVERGRDRRLAGGGRPAARPAGAGPGAAAGTDGSARRVSARRRVGIAATAAGGRLGFRRARVGPPAGASSRRPAGSAAVRALRGRIPNQITTAASAAKPDAATAVRPSREMAILIHTLSAALFGSLRRLCSKRPWRSGQSGAPGTCP